MSGFRSNGVQLKVLRASNPPYKVSPSPAPACLFFYEQDIGFALVSSVLLFVLEKIGMKKERPLERRF